jgi:hypothetical protein
MMMFALTKTLLAGARLAAVPGGIRANRHH